MCMLSNRFLGRFVSVFPAFASQCNVFRNQRHATAIGGNGTPRQAQFLRGGGQRQLVSCHPVLKGGSGHNVAALFQREAIKGTGGYFNIVTPSYIKTPFTAKRLMYALKSMVCCLPLCHVTLKWWFAKTSTAVICILVVIT